MCQKTDATLVRLDKEKGVDVDKERSQKPKEYTPALLQKEKTSHVNAGGKPLLCAGSKLQQSVFSVTMNTKRTTSSTISKKDELKAPDRDKHQTRGEMQPPELNERILYALVQSEREDCADSVQHLQTEPLVKLSKLQQQVCKNESYLL